MSWDIIGLGNSRHVLYYVYAMPKRRLPASEDASKRPDNKSPSKAWGVGRVAFLARIDAIKVELAQGWSLKAIYQRHKDRLAVGYSSFCKLVSRHAADARPVVRTQVQPAPPAGPKSAPGMARVMANPPENRRGAPEPPAISEEGSSAHDGHQPARTFNHDPIERPGDYERLFGARKR
jgi:Family of unknown function (DUF5338)